MPRWAWLASLAIACGQPANTAQPRPPQPVAAPVDAAVDARLADDLPQLAARARDLYVEWGAAFADGTIDCATATARVNALADKYADVTEANKEVFRAGHDRVRAFRAELDRYEAEMMPIAKSIMESPIMSRCAPETEFAQAIDRLQGDA